MSSCGCVYSDSDGDLPAFSDVRDVKARKPYKCCECRESIQVGALHQRVVGKWDGRVMTVRSCLVCAEIRGLLFCDGWTYGAMWEDVLASFQEGMNPMGCINQLESVSAKEKLSAEWRAYKGLSEPPQERER